MVKVSWTITLAWQMRLADGSYVTQSASMKGSSNFDGRKTVEQMRDELYRFACEKMSAPPERTSITFFQAERAGKTVGDL